MNEARPASFFERTVARFRRAWREVTEAPRAAPAPPMPRPDLPVDDAAHIREQMRVCLEAAGGEVSARARAADLGRTYLALNETGRERFLRILADEFDTDPATVDRAVERLRQANDPRQRRAAEQGLRSALEAPRVRLLTQFNGLAEGVKFLVDMRAEILRLARANPASNLAALESDLRGLLAAWFDIGFLELRRITWNAPAALLEKLAMYEAVHAIQSWQDLKNRLDSDRRCFAFFHPRMPEEPLIFIEVALVRGLADNVQTLLDEAAPATDLRSADTAIFYSISNAQAGLAGISFGGFLIKRVVDLLQAEFPGLATFATLSPIPGFLRWLDERLAAEGGAALITDGEWAALRALPASIADTAVLRAVLKAAGWAEDSAMRDALKGPLTRLCAHYLLEARRPRGGALDPVAHFHLSNGARMERLNWLGDRSEKGLRESAGLMINYLYRLGEIEANHEAYTAQGQLAAVPAIRALLNS
ncbi:MAG: malonyl-CoA decarboxylase [Alphaproteobacteria bacterium]